MVEVERAMVSTGLAPLRDSVTLRRYDQLRLRVVTLRAQHEFTDEPVFNNYILLLHPKH